jgi:hypothetical protein
LREDAQKLKKEKATLEGMVESRDEFITEIAMEIGLDHMGEDVEDKEEDEDDDDGGDTTKPSAVVVPPPAPAPPIATVLEEIVEEEDLDYLDDLTEASSDMAEWFPEDGSNDWD